MTCRYCDHPDKACYAQEEAEHCADMADQREVERILAMSPEELREDFIARGEDPDEVIAEMDRSIRLAVLQAAAERAIAWHEDHDKALSKQPPNNDIRWRRMEHQEQARELRTAVAFMRRPALKLEGAK